VGEFVGERTGQIAIVATLARHRGGATGSSDGSVRVGYTPTDRRATWSSAAAAPA
jgi:hypothetical protein